MNCTFCNAPIDMRRYRSTRGKTRDSRYCSARCRRECRRARSKLRSAIARERMYQSRLEQISFGGLDAPCDFHETEGEAAGTIYLAAD